MSTHIYVVTDIETIKRRLIRAGNRTQAIRHAAQTRFDVAYAEQDDLVGLLSAGIAIEMAGEGAIRDMFDDVKEEA